jgi:hypothetical protein
LLLAASVASGCTRAFYRKQADCESLTIIDRADDDPRWLLRDYRIYPDPRSRFWSPTNTDYPPMPPDDPTAHQLMHCVDCKQGFPCWHKNGDTAYVESPVWQNYLPLNEEGILELNFDESMQIAYINSRDYQTQLENLYLSALDVTFERFRFDVQFFGTNDTNAVFAGPVFARRPGGLSQLSTTTTPSMRRLLASGGQFVIEAANSIVWQFAGPNTTVTTTLADFSFVQPLLRGASRAVVLERLTLAERSLLYNVRAMYRYQQGFYVELYTGRNAPAGPQRRGGLTGGTGLQGFSGVGAGGFGRIGAIGTAGVTGGGFTGGAGAAQASGFLGLLQDAIQIQNLQANVNGLRDSLAQLQAAYDAGRIDRFQVDLARQALFNAQSRLLTARAAYQTSVDSFKLDLGIPPHTEVRINDPLLDQFQLLHPELLVVQENIGHLLDKLRNPDLGLDAPLDQADLDEALDIRRGAAARFAVLESDYDRLQRNKGKRLESLRNLRQRSEEEGIEVGPIAYSEEAFNARLESIQRDYEGLTDEFDAASEELVAFSQLPREQWTAQRGRLIALATTLSSIMERLLLLQARARIDAATLETVELDPVKALRIAAEHRVDWMNARGGLIDQWRLIQFNANALKGGLNLVVSGDLGTVGNNPIRFRGTNGQLRVGLEFDAPLTRVAERNNYRQSIIEFLQARRSYMLFVDSIDWQLRNELRTIRLNQLNFELRRAAVLIAIDQVDITTLRLRQPPRPGEQSQLGVTAARDLVDSLTNLLNVQNDFLSVWVNYEVQRLGLDFDLGTMMLDDRGMWIDPGPIKEDTYDARRGKFCPDPVLAEDYPELHQLLFPDSHGAGPDQLANETSDPSDVPQGAPRSASP